VLIAAGCAEPAAVPQIPVAPLPVPAGPASIWFYRDWLPPESLNLANIDVNGSASRKPAGTNAKPSRQRRSCPNCTWPNWLTG
jgi:hypothetical protein